MANKSNPAAQRISTPQGSGAVRGIAVAQQVATVGEQRPHAFIRADVADAIHWLRHATRGMLPCDVGATDMMYAVAGVCSPGAKATCAGETPTIRT